MPVIKLHDGINQALLVSLTLYAELFAATATV